MTYSQHVQELLTQGFSLGNAERIALSYIRGKDPLLDYADKLYASVLEKIAAQHLPKP